MFCPNDRSAQAFVDKFINSFYKNLLTNSKNKALTEVEKIKILNENTILKKDGRYFDFTASGLALKLVERRLVSFLPYYANTHSSSSLNALLTTNLYEKSKKIIKNSIGVDDDFVLLGAGSGASGAIFLFQNLLGLYTSPKLKEKLEECKIGKMAKIIITPFEHHSNELSWRNLMVDIYKMKFKNNSSIDLEDLEKALKATDPSTPIIASLNLASNVTGLLLNYAEVVPLLRKYNATIALDMASSAPHININSKYFDAAFISPHKLLGGIGSCGLLLARRELFHCDYPIFAGGGSISYASCSKANYLKDYENREDAGTPPILQMIRAALAYKIRDEMGLDFIKAQENLLTKIFLEKLKSIPAIEIYGQLEDRLSTISFNLANISPYILGKFLDKKYNIIARAGCSCAGPYGHMLLNLEEKNDINEFETMPGWLRISLHYTHTLDDIDYLINALKDASRTLR